MHKNSEKNSEKKKKNININKNPLSTFPLFFFNTCDSLNYKVVKVSHIPTLQGYHENSNTRQLIYKFRQFSPRLAPFILPHLIKHGVVLFSVRNILNIINAMISDKASPLNRVALNSRPLF